MALIKCSECGATASTSAKSCPGCGASAKAMRKGQSRWPTTRRGWALLGCSGLMVAGLDGNLMRVFQIVGLDQILTFAPTVADAIGALKPTGDQ